MCTKYGESISTFKTKGESLFTHIRDEYTGGEGTVSEADIVATG
jgi:hypothetical protein